MSFTGRPKRIIQYSNNDDMHAYVASGKRLPGVMARGFCDPVYLIPFHALVQWNAWLTHTRREPPTLEVRPVPAGT